MTNIKAFTKSHSAWIYFVLTFFISWGGVLLAIGGVSGIPANAEQIRLHQGLI